MTHHGIEDAKAAQKAVEKGEAGKRKPEVLTPERAIQSIRELRAGGIQVQNMEFVDLLLAKYDDILADLREYQIREEQAAEDAAGEDI